MVLYKKQIISNHIIKFNNIYKSLKLSFSSKFNIYNIYIILKVVKVISTITISSNLKNETDMKIISALEVLDFFFDKKADINKLNSVYIRKAKSIIFVTRSIINH
jgi:hypothetical protein